MNLNLTGVVLLGAGVLFLYSAVKNVKPQDFLRDTIKGGGAKPAAAPAGSATTPTPPVQPFENRSGL